MSTKYQAPRGTIDLLPPESLKQLHVENVFRDHAENYGYQPIRTPMFEATELYVRGAGESSDIVSKEMYTFDDKKGRSMTLRPEGTPGVVRALIQSGWNFSQQAKLYYVGSMFRYQRPQKGRYREHTQCGVEILGAESLTADVEVISLGVNYLQSMGLDNLRIAINSIGSFEDRQNYNIELKEFIQKHSDGFCPDCHFRVEHNPLRVFDCKVPGCLDILRDAPRVDRALSDASKHRFEKVQELLRGENFEIDVDPMLVRGLDYYTHTVFEVMLQGDTGQQSSLMGGGRYNGLVELYGGPPTPAMGFGCGIERIMDAIDWVGLEDLLYPECDIAVIAMGEPAREAGILLANILRNAGLIVHMDHRETSMKNQLGQANTLKAVISVIIGEDEINSGIATIKEMETGGQESIPIGAVVEYILGGFKQGEAEEVE